MKKKSAKKAKPKCIVCQQGKGDHLCPACKKSLAGLQRKNHNAAVFDEDIARWAARRGAAVLRKKYFADMDEDWAEDKERVENFRSLLVSLPWAPHSAHHNSEVLRLLDELCPDVDFSKELKEFTKVCLQPPQKGSPKQPLPTVEVAGLTEESMKEEMASTPGAQIASALRKAGVLVTDWHLSQVSPTTTLITIGEDAPEHDELVVVDLSSGEYSTVSPHGCRRFQWVPEVRRIIAGHPTPGADADWVQVSVSLAMRLFDEGYHVKQFRGPGVGYTTTSTRPVDGKEYMALRTRVLDLMSPLSEQKLPPTGTEST